MKNRFYVYALIDPRDKEIFYIGKGSGNRHTSHLKERGKNISNIEKYMRIQEIQQENFQVKIEILFPYLSEMDALYLEKIMIYKLGRKCFKEGELLNVVPGGNWKPKDSVFYSEEEKLKEFNLDKLDFVARERYLSIKKISDFSYWEKCLKTLKIFKYDKNGKLISIDSLDCFFRDLSSNQFELFSLLANEDLPIHDFDYLYAKRPIKNIYISSVLPIPYLHFFDSSFCEKFDLLYSKGNDFDIDFKNDGVVRLRGEKEGNQINFTSFYKNGSKKAFRSINLITPEKENINWDEKGKILNYYKISSSGKKKYITYFQNGKIKSSNSYNDDKLLSESKTFYDTGELKDWNQYFNHTRIKIRTGYFKNGQIRFKYGNYHSPFNYIYYNEKGEVIEKFDSKRGYILFNKDGTEKAVLTSRKSTFLDYHHILKDFNPDNSPKATREELLKQQQEADEDWAKFMGLKKRQ